MVVSFVVLPGFEPRQADPESDVLPLHHRTMMFRSLEIGCKSTHIFASDQIFFKISFSCLNFCILDMDWMVVFSSFFFLMAIFSPFFGG